MGVISRFQRPRPSPRAQGRATHPGFTRANNFCVISSCPSTIHWKFIWPSWKAANLCSRSELTLL